MLRSHASDRATIRDCKFTEENMAFAIVPDLEKAEEVLTRILRIALQLCSVDLGNGLV